MATSKVQRAAKRRAIYKIRTWVARLKDEIAEYNHFDCLPPHLQLHIREMAAETFAKEHMRWEVHVELLFQVGRRTLRSLQQLVVEELRNQPQTDSMH